MTSDSPSRFRTLDPQRIVETIQLLETRILERFPGSGLGQVCGQLLQISREAQQRAQWIGRPIIALRLAIWFLVALICQAVNAQHGSRPRGRPICW